MAIRQRRVVAPFFKIPVPYNPSTGSYQPIRPPVSDPPTAVLAVLLAQFNDYLVVNAYSESELGRLDAQEAIARESPYNGTEFAVAKPFLLQRTPFDGQSITYPGFNQLDGEGEMVVQYTYLDIGLRLAQDVNGVEEDERQRVTPDYFVNDILTIMHARCASTVASGLTRNDSQDTYADGSPIEWIDMNCGARAWALWEEE